MSWEKIKYGPIGEAVEANLPGSEGDPIGIFGALLSIYSAGINGKVYMGQSEQESNRPAAVWSILVGHSADAAKGDALRAAVGALGPNLRDFYHECRRSGITSGAALVTTVAGRIQDGANLDEPDGRVFILEEEWADVLRAASRDKNYSSRLRQAWDGKPIENRTTKAHVGVPRPLLGFHAHITPGEWGAYLSRNDALGGSYNRMLPLYVQRSKMLHTRSRGNFTPSSALEDAYQWACEKPRTISMTPRADDVLFEIRTEIAEEVKDMDPAQSVFLSRGAEHIARIAMAYTACEKKTKISVAAVKAAYELVRYSMSSLEKITTEVANLNVPRGMGRPVTPLDQFVRNILERAGGEILHTGLARHLAQRGIRGPQVRELMSSYPWIDVQVREARVPGPKPVHYVIKDEKAAETPASPPSLSVVPSPRKKASARPQPRKAAAKKATQKKKETS
ncbi:DUF3987 domain-containing protein [Streptomyces sp. Tu6071]|uniref:DUF3987 domain-containing protein n=1 Tax=Streptomyces sp. Tu6071 TaxID=355249 RepID=UPI00131A274F|nr:DUF3987 domain-containing protein [Streptomyces sp. Tu6071]